VIDFEFVLDGFAPLLLLVTAHPKFERVNEDIPNGSSEGGVEISLRLGAVPRTVFYFYPKMEEGDRDMLEFLLTIPTTGYL
jgi:hypothetical protein